MINSLAKKLMYSLVRHSNFYLSEQNIHLIMTDIKQKVILKRCQLDNASHHSHSRDELSKVIIQSFFFEDHIIFELPKVLIDIICEYTYQNTYLLKTIYTSEYTESWTRTHLLYKNFFVCLVYDSVQIIDIISGLIAHEYKAEHLTECLKFHDIPFQMDYPLGSNQTFFLIDNDSSVVLYHCYRKILNIIITEKDKVSFVPLNIDVGHLVPRNNNILDHEYISLNTFNTYYRRVCSFATLHDEDNIYSVDIKASYDKRDVSDLPKLFIKLKPNHNDHHNDLELTMPLLRNVYHYGATLCRLKRKTFTLILIGLDFFRYSSYSIPDMKEIEAMNENDIISTIYGSRGLSSTDQKINLSYVRWYCDDNYFYGLCSPENYSHVISGKTYILIKIKLYCNNPSGYFVYPTKCNTNDKSKNRITFCFLEISTKCSIGLQNNHDNFRMIDDNVYFKNSNDEYMCYTKYIK